MQTKLAIVILNWNGRNYLEKFLPVLKKYNAGYAEIIIADNASDDESLAFLAENHPEIKIVRNEQNWGFAKGYNEALKQIDAQYYCLLNSDIEVSSNWIDPIINMMDSDSTIAAAQPKLRSYHNRDYFEYAGACGGFLDKLGYPFCRGRLFENVEKDEDQYENVIDIFWATGAALFVRSEVYHQIGGLDEDFFAHMEEIDFCWRIKNQGHRILVIPQAVVYHVGGGTLPKNNSRKTYLNFRNNLLLLQKNLPENRLFITFFCRFFLDNIAALVFLLKGQPADFAAVYKAFFGFLKLRKKVKAKRVGFVKNAFLETYPYSIVFAHYILRKKIFDGRKLKS
ncbi:glycosyltransferase family 2 protein [Bacteroidales bacterium OttesenSCG-928-B11]|nr:glycosyltransferase family 2 protein [Bacteroidales bacterium OttesenSCG-928-E04]MDL2308230.1 glycosyltransferase family 2 protein [Bacteroidales bacterium OttesenSCG-928-C03]MDL2311530.1 glycosyltransferase family 2 protein [Bacteroidales bacterium OttesenSCG-928-B11]